MEEGLEEAGFEEVLAALDSALDSAEEVSALLSSEESSEEASSEETSEEDPSEPVSEEVSALTPEETEEEASEEGSEASEAAFPQAEKVRRAKNTASTMVNLRCIMSKFLSDVCCFLAPIRRVPRFGTLFPPFQRLR